MNGRAIPGAYLFRLYVCDKEMSWPHHIEETHQPDWVVYVGDSEKFWLTNLIPERIIFVSQGIVFAMTRNKRPKYAKRLWSQGLFNDGVQHGYGLFRVLHIEDGSGYTNFVRMTRSDLEIMLQKTGPRIQGKDTKFRETVPPSIRLA